MEGASSNPQEICVPNDIIWECLTQTRLSAKYAVRHASLIYKNILYEPYFILKQTINSSAFDGGFFVRRTWFRQEDDNRHITFHVLPKEDPSEFGIPGDFIDYLNHRTRLLNSNQGLLVFSDLVDDWIFVCNLVTKTFTPIPYPLNAVNIRALNNGSFVLRFSREGRDFPNDYTLITTVFVDAVEDPGNNVPHLAVYRHKNWVEEMCALRRNLMTVRCKNPVCLFSGPDGGLLVHFLYDRNDVVANGYAESYVAAYEIDTMSLLTTVKLQDGAWIHDGVWVDYRPWVEICSFGESLGLFRIARRRIIVWVLEEYTPVRWRMVIDKTLSDMGEPEYERAIHGCCVVNGKGLLFATLNQIYLYGMEGSDANRFEVIGKHGIQPPLWSVDFVMYANTLRPIPGEKCIQQHKYIFD